MFFFLILKIPHINRRNGIIEDAEAARFVDEARLRARWRLDLKGYSAMCMISFDDLRGFAGMFLSQKECFNFFIPKGFT